MENLKMKGQLKNSRLYNIHVIIIFKYSYSSFND